MLTGIIQILIKLILKKDNCTCCHRNYAQFLFDIIFQIIMEMIIKFKEVYYILFKDIDNLIFILMLSKFLKL